MKISVLDANAFGPYVELGKLEPYGTIEIYGFSNGGEVPARIGDAEIIITDLKPLGEAELSGAKNLKLICEMGTGYDNVDLEYCRRRGIGVCNVKGYCAASVAEHTLALALTLAHRMPALDDYIRGGEYFANAGKGYFEEYRELAGKTWGIVGLGNIGRKTARLAEAFGCRIVYCSMSGTAREEEYECVSFEELLRISDLISLHCPLNEKTKHLFDCSAFSKMKPTALLINVARGPVVDTEALFDTLKNHVIAGAALDVFETEPLPMDHELLTLPEKDRIILTPHVAWNSAESKIRLLDEICENIRSYQEGGKRNRVD